MAALQSGRRGWTAFFDQPQVLTFEYSFGPGVATALAVRIGEGLAVVSPPSRPTEEVFEALAAHGPVKALVAPNAFHTLGLTPW